MRKKGKQDGARRIHCCDTSLSRATPQLRVARSCLSDIRRDLNPSPRLNICLSATCEASHETGSVIASIPVVVREQGLHWLPRDIASVHEHRVKILHIWLGRPVPAVPGGRWLRKFRLFLDSLLPERVPETRDTPRGNQQPRLR